MECSSLFLRAPAAAAEDLAAAAAAAAVAAFVRPSFHELLYVRHF